MPTELAARHCATSRTNLHHQHHYHPCLRFNHWRFRKELCARPLAPYWLLYPHSRFTNNVTLCHFPWVHQWHSGPTAHCIIQRLVSFPAFSCSKSLSCYLSMPSAEVDTSPLVSVVLDSGRLPCEIVLIFDNVDQGRTLFVPKITTKSGEMDFLKLYDKADLADLPNGVWGIKEPDPNWQGRPRVRGESTTRLWHGLPYGLILVWFYSSSSGDIRIRPYSPPCRRVR